MKVQNIRSYNYNSNNFCRKNFTSAKHIDGSKAAATFGLWFGFGVGLDLLSRKIHISKSPFKNSLAINGILATIAAGAVLFKEIAKQAGKNSRE